MDQNTKLLIKREELKKELKKNLLLSSEGFKASDVPLGIIVGLLGIGICIWIPVIGWILIPIIALTFPLLGTHFRQENAKKEVKKLRSEVESISLILGD